MKYIELKIGLEVDLIKDPDTGNYIQFEWRDVVDYEGCYQVSNYGHVKSIDREVIDCNGSVKYIKSKLRNCKVTGDYRRVGLYKEGKSPKGKSIHRLVASSFIDNPCNKPQVNHIDGDKSNNVVTNLEWVTPSENMEHAYNTGLSGKGEDHGGARLSSEDVISICEMLDCKGHLHTDIASKFKVDPSTIQKIHLGTHWNWLTDRKDKVKASDRKGNSHWKSRKVGNCRGEVFDTVTQAADKYKTSTTNISAVCNGKRYTARKYYDGTPIKWKYLDNN